MLIRLVTLSVATCKPLVNLRWQTVVDRLVDLSLNSDSIRHVLIILVLITGTSEKLMYK
jgi:hypothetical protein